MRQAYATGRINQVVCARCEGASAASASAAAERKHRHRHRHRSPRRPTTGRARSAAEAAGNPTLWQSSTTSTGSSKRVQRVRLSSSPSLDYGLEPERIGFDDRSVVVDVRLGSKTGCASRCSLHYRSHRSGTRLTTATTRTHGGPPERGTETVSVDTAAGRQAEQLTAGRTAISPSVSGRASSSPVREMTRQTVGMYAGAKREQCDRSESGLNTIGLERDTRHDRAHGRTAPPRSLSVDQDWSVAWG